VRVLDLRKAERPIAGVEYRQGDVRHLETVKKAMADISHVIHLAAIVSVNLCQEDPLTSEQTNVVGTGNVLQAARTQSPPPRVIFASSAAVYGNLGDHGRPLSEAESKLNPLSFYAAQKIAGEQQIQLYASHFKVPTLSFRFFNVFGPGQDPKSPYSGVISIFQERIRTNKALLLNEGGPQTRDFIHVSDIAAACLRALSIDVQYFDGRAINLGSGEKLTVAELAAEMKRITNCATPTENSPARPGDVRHSLADISLARKILGWEPKVSLSRGLEELLKNHPA
jgi:UDP-glucose 4-epimerase